MSSDKLARLSRKLNYQFNDTQLLELALTHRSRGAINYERLEFLGDSILGFVVADWLYAQFPKLAEGKLSRMRSSLVRKETLAGVARTLNLGDFLILGEGELKSGGFNRDSILSDAVESLIGAIYLDGGFAPASQFIHVNFTELFNNITDQTNFKDAKSRLQEVMQKRSLALPVYTIVGSRGEHHEQEFSVECSLPDLQIRTHAVAKSRRQAEQRSAELILEQLKED